MKATPVKFNILPQQSLVRYKSIIYSTYIIYRLNLIEILLRVNHVELKRLLIITFSLRIIDYLAEVTCTISVYKVFSISQEDLSIKYSYWLAYKAIKILTNR